VNADPGQIDLGAIDTEKGAEEILQRGRARRPPGAARGLHAYSLAQEYRAMADRNQLFRKAFPAGFEII
jgi:hypothetical protein